MSDETVERVQKVLEIDDFVYGKRKWWLRTPMLKRDLRKLIALAARGRDDK